MRLRRPWIDASTAHDGGRLLVVLALVAIVGVGIWYPHHRSGQLLHETVQARGTGVQAPVPGGVPNATGSLCGEGEAPVHGGQDHVGGGPTALPEHRDDL
jgi:hypothetical protein